MWIIRVAITCFLMEGFMGLNSPPKPFIIIVGSGASGIAAATRLLKNNFTNLKILEAENRIGGRINSVKFGDAYIDLGAEFCFADEDSIAYSMVKDLNVLKLFDGTPTFYRSSGEKVSNETNEKLTAFVQSLLPSNKTIKECENAKSVGECLNITTKALVKRAQSLQEKEVFSDVYDWAYTYLSAYNNAVDLNDLSTIMEYKPGNNVFMAWNGSGFKTVLEVMMQKYPNKEAQLPIDDKILLGKTVNNISNWQKGDKVTVTTIDGSIYEADHVIFTPSVGVLKANHQHLFYPPLPDEKIEAIKNIGYGTIAKVALHFPERFWTSNMLMTFLWSNTDKEKLQEKNLEWLINLFGFTPVENNPNVLVAMYGGHLVPLIESLSEEKLLEGHKYLIDTFLTRYYNVSKPDALIRTTWYSNPNFRGTYSYQSVQGLSTRGGYFQKLGCPLTNENGKMAVLFAGEATHPYYFSSVHGAIESGYREGDRLIHLYTN